MGRPLAVVRLPISRRQPVSRLMVLAMGDCPRQQYGSYFLRRPPGQDIYTHHAIPNDFSPNNRTDPACQFSFKIASPLDLKRETWTTLTFVSWRPRVLLI